MSSEYELFGATRCDAVLPTSLVTEEQTFGQFITLAASLGGATRFLSLRDAPGNDANPAVVRLGSDQVSLYTMVQPEPEKHVVNLVAALDEAELNRLLVERELKTSQGMWQIRIGPAQVAALLNGQAAPVLAETDEGIRTVTVEPPPRAAELPATSRNEIDLADFLVNPVIPGIGGLPYRVELSPQMVADLRNWGTSRFGVGETSIELVVSDARPSAWETGQPGGGYAGPGLGAYGDYGPRVALFLPWKQRWELLGYSRGLLLHSLSLAPQEETTIELFTWDRRKRSLEQESEAETEETFERADITKDSADVVQELTNSNEFQIQADARVRITYPVVNAEIGGQLSNMQKVARISKQTSQHLAESTTKAATRVKTRRKTRITESAEFGREERVTRKVRNPNMCHALNLDYFEIVANYTITVQFAEEDAALCVLVDMPGDIVRIPLDAPLTCRIHEQALRAALLDRNLAAGFDAARFLAARDEAKKLLCDKVRCPVEPAPSAPVPGTVSTAPPAPPVVPAEVSAGYAELRRIVGRLRDARPGSLMFALKNGPPSSAPRPSLNEFRSWLYWSLFTRLLPSLSDALESALAAPLQDGAAPIARSLPAAGALHHPRNLNEDPPHREDFDVIVRVALRDTPWTAGNWWWGRLREAGALFPHDLGLPAALEDFAKAWLSWQAERQAGSLEPAGEPPVTQQQLQQQRMDMDNDRLEYAFPLKETAEAQERLNALTGHLDRHHSYYRYAILQAMPLGDQMQMLASENAPLELCEPRVIGMIPGSPGAPDRLAVPLNLSLLEAGELRQEWRELKRFADDILDDLSATEVGERRIDLPTPGIALETRLGSCDACEPFIARSREIDLAQRREQVRAAEAATDLQQLEARRYAARLDGTEPRLDDPRTSDEGVRLRLDPVRVVVEQPPRP